MGADSHFPSNQPTLCSPLITTATTTTATTTTTRATGFSTNGDESDDDDIYLESHKEKRYLADPAATSPNPRKRVVYDLTGSDDELEMVGPVSVSTFR